MFLQQSNYLYRILNNYFREMCFTWWELKKLRNTVLWSIHKASFLQTVRFQISVFSKAEEQKDLAMQVILQWIPETTDMIQLMSRDPITITLYRHFKNTAGEPTGFMKHLNMLLHKAILFLQ